MDQGTQSDMGMGLGVQAGLDWFQQYITYPLQYAWAEFWRQLGLFAPKILGCLLLLLIGVVIAKLIEQLLVRFFKVIALDKIASQIQLSSILAKGGIRAQVSELVGGLVYWIVMLAVVMAVFNALNLDVAARLFADLLDYVPNVIAALFILIAGILAAAFLSVTVRTAASNAGILQSSLLGQFVQVSILVVTAVSALKQVGIQFIDQVFLLLFAGVSLAIAIAFGLGSKDLAGRWMSDLVEQIQGRKR